MKTTWKLSTFLMPPSINLRPIALFNWGLTASVTLLVAQILAWMALPDPGGRSLINTVAALVASIFASGGLAVAAQQSRRWRPRLALPWLLLLLAALCWVVVNLLELIFRPGSPLLSVDFFHLATYPFFLMMIILLPSEKIKRTDLLQIGLDFAVILLSFCLLFWEALFSPALFAAAHGLPRLLVSAAYPVGDLMLLWALLMIVFRPFSGQPEPPLWWLAASLGAALLFDLFRVLFPAGAQTDLGQPGRLLFTLVPILMMLCGLRQTADMPIPASPITPRPPSLQAVQLLLPYGWLAAVYLAIPVLLTTGRLSQTSLLPLLAAVITLLVIARQILMIRENKRLSNQLHTLNADLERRVIDRTAALSHANEALRRAVTEREQTERLLRDREEKLVYNALHDNLTNLPNRALVSDRLDQALRRMRRDADYHFAVLFLDLDGFKVINDSLGHQAGDQLLVQTARRLRSCVRDLDTVARLGGDEFVIILNGIQTQDSAAASAQRITTALAAPFKLDDQVVFIGASMGIVPSRPDYTEPAELLRDADLALYEAKAQGKARFVFFTSELRSLTLDRLTLEKDLRGALDRGELSLNYQPIFSFESGRIAGFEALLRWNHPSRGWVPPKEFIPIAEATGLIGRMTLMVLEEALQRLHAWQKSFVFQPALSMSVNLSARLFNQPDLLERVRTLLVETGIPPCSLTLEITESAIIQDAEKASRVLTTWRNMGVQVHMDDFGTGYSSLSYLHQFPIDTLKIDQTFVSHLSQNSKNAEIVRIIVSLARELNIEVIAEGIETAEQLTFIRQIGCHGGQGFYISRPLDTDTAWKYLARQCEKV